MLRTLFEEKLANHRQIIIIINTNWLSRLWEVYANIGSFKENIFGDNGKMQPKLPLYAQSCHHHRPHHQYTNHHHQYVLLREGIEDEKDLHPYQLCVGSNKGETNWMKVIANKGWCDWGKIIFSVIENIDLSVVAIDNDDEDKKEIVHGCRSTVEQMSKPPT